jgi:two-component system, cell cycle sensor histidine kinase and response regulator CckA
MGLAVVYGIVPNHGGAIDYESEVGRRTVFTLRLPQTNEPPAVFQSTPPQKPAVVGRSSILLIDDEEVVRVAAARML